MNYTLQEIVAHARVHSPFYKSLYASVAKEICNIEQLPILDQDEFWSAAQSGSLLAGSQDNGIVFKSGGTTGSPKFSVFTQREWDRFTQVFGRGIADGGGIKSGEKVANIFYAGQLYASFLFIMRSLDQSPVQITQFPIGGACPLEEMVKTIKEFQIDVVAGVPTSIMQIAAYAKEHNEKLPHLKRVLYGGEAMYPDQMETMKVILPHVTCQSIGWASVDGGLLGYFAPDCKAGEHRVFDGATIMEIVDPDSGDVIHDCDVPGKVLLSNLTRKLMPILRYPAGDMAVWVEPKGSKNRKMKLVGRSNEGARVGPATIYLDDVRKVLQNFQSRLDYLGFQLVVEHHSERDQLEICIGCSQLPARSEELSIDILKALYAERKMLRELAESKLIHNARISFKLFDALEKNVRTGKLKSVIDRRFQP